MLRAVAEHWGAKYVETLTGFKWIWDHALEEVARGDLHLRVRRGARLLHWACGRDKDGVGAAQILMERQPT